MILAEEADRAEVGLLIRGKVAKGDITFEEAVEFSGVTDADTVPEDEELELHHEMEGRPPVTVLPWVRIEWIKPTLVVKVINNIRNVTFEVILFDSLCDVLRQEVLLILIA